jgi:hypothetical protein
MLIPAYVLTYLATTKSYNLYKKYQIYSIEKTVQQSFSKPFQVHFYHEVDEYRTKQQYQISTRDATVYIWNQWKANGLIQQALSN